MLGTVCLSIQEGLLEGGDAQGQPSGKVSVDQIHGGTNKLLFLFGIYIFPL